MSLSHRLQILLEEDQYVRLSHRAKAEGRSVGALVREAVDHMWTASDVSKAAALESILAAEPMPVGTPEELKREIDDVRAARFPSE